MQSPKDPQATLIEETWPDGLKVHRCPTTGGLWIDRADYADWQERCASDTESRSLLAIVNDLATIEIDPAEEDGRVALCPVTSRFLIRARVDTPTPFYIERSPEDGGFWLDRGEWDVLVQLGLHIQLDVLFSSEWQAKLRDRQQTQRQRQATIDKLGEDLAQKIFDLAEALRDHPNGDFGVAYLMQQFDRPSV